MFDTLVLVKNEFSFLTADVDVQTIFSKAVSLSNIYIDGKSGSKSVFSRVGLYFRFDRLHTSRFDVEWK